MPFLRFPQLLSLACFALLGISVAAFVTAEKQFPEYPQGYRADGGIFTADKALELKLIDKIGYLPDAVQDAHDSASLGENFRAIQYEKPKALAELLLGALRAIEEQLLVRTGAATLHAANLSSDPGF